jgi:hypothetical protein
VAGFGPVDADACRDLAQRLAAGPGTRWCLTLTGQDGRAVAHGCACAGPRPATSGCRRHLAGGGDDPAAGARQSGHARQVQSYRPGRTLRHLIDIRHRTCGFPGCRRSAVRCDADHTVPFDQGGATCECNLAPLCSLCRCRHKLHYADLGIMPTWRLGRLVAAAQVA